MTQKLTDPTYDDEWTADGGPGWAEAAAILAEPRRDGSPVDPEYPDLQHIVEASTAVARGDAAAFLVAGTAPGRFRVAVTHGSFPTPIGEAVSLQDDRLLVSDALATPEVPVLSVPVALHGTHLGALVALAPAGAPREASLALLNRLAARAAPAAAANRAAALEQQLTELGAIVEVGQVLTGLLDMEDVLSYVVYLAESLVGGHAASVALVSEDGSELILKNSTGNLRDSEGQRVPLRGSLIGWVVEKGEAVITPNVSDDPRSYSLGVREGPGVVVPITNNGKVMGAFLVSRLEDSPAFGEESAAVLQRMAAYAAIAISNAETHRHQREIAETLRSQASQLEQAYGELSRSQEQLLVSEKMAALGRVTAGIAHEINSPLGGILNSLRAARGFVEEYRTSISDPEITPEDHQAIADDILNTLSTADSAVMKVAQFVKSIKGQTRAGEGTTSVFDPAMDVDAAVVLLQHELKRRRVAVFTEMERGHRLSGDQGKFGLVVQNLITNALDAYGDQPGEVWVRLKQQDGALHLSVEDRGCGIPEEIRGRIFDYLFTTKDMGKGTGLGLAMVHSVVTSTFHGQIDLESEVGKGTTFTLILPLTPAATDHGA